MIRGGCNPAQVCRLVCLLEGQEQISVVGALENFCGGIKKKQSCIIKIG